MTDTVITPNAYERDSNAAGWAVAVIVLLGVILFGIFVWPGLMRTGNTTSPSTIDVNVRTPQGQQGTTPAGGNMQNQNSGGSVPMSTQ